MQSLLRTATALIVTVCAAHASASSAWGDRDLVETYAQALAPPFVAPARPPWRCWFGPIEEPSPYGCIKLPRPTMPICTPIPTVGAVTVNVFCVPIK